MAVAASADDAAGAEFLLPRLRRDDDVPVFDVAPLPPLPAGVFVLDALPPASLVMLLAAAPDGTGVVAAELLADIVAGIEAAASFSSFDGVEARESASLPLELELSALRGFVAVMATGWANIMDGFVYC